MDMSLEREVQLLYRQLVSDRGRFSSPNQLEQLQISLYSSSHTLGYQAYSALRRPVQLVCESLLCCPDLQFQIAHLQLDRGFRNLAH